MMKLKKIIALLLAAILCLSFAACGINSNSEATGKKDEETVTHEDNSVTYKFGDTITTADNMFEFTPVFEGYAEKLANWPDEGYLTPYGAISGKTPYEADEEKVMMYFSGKINYIGEAKENKTFRYDFTVDYDNGYLFEFAEGDAWNRGKGYHSGCGVTTGADYSEWKYNNFATFEPLSSNKIRNVRFCIEVPVQLKSNQEKIVFNFYLNGENYNFVIAE